MSRQEHPEVGHFNSRASIVVYREPEVGIAWEAEAVGMGQAALGDTPREAVHNLIRALNERGISGDGHVDDEALDALSSKGRDDG